MSKCCQCKCCLCEYAKPPAPKPYVMRFVNVYLSVTAGVLGCGALFSTRNRAVEAEVSRNNGDLVYLRTIQVKIPR